MASPRVLVLRSPGTNCDVESAHAFELCGGQPTAVHVNQLIAQPEILDGYQILCFPGGFSFGDDISAGQILATWLRGQLLDQLRGFVDRGNLVLGICNGFQVLIKTGLLVEPDDQGARATLTWNTNGRYTARWVELEVPASRSVFLQGIEQMYLPVAHAEGRFLARDQACLGELENNGQLALRYSTRREDQNPNGSMDNIAGICDVTGRVLGLMPHPERYVHPLHDPRWTRHAALPTPHGLAIFENAVKHFETFARSGADRSACHSGT